MCTVSLSLRAGFRTIHMRGYVFSYSHVLPGVVRLLVLGLI